MSFSGTFFTLPIDFIVRLRYIIYMIKTEESKNMTTEINEAVQAIREMAITEIMLENEDLKKAMKEYLTVSVYNKINGNNTTIANLDKEIEAQNTLAKMLDSLEVTISKKMLEIVNR